MQSSSVTRPQITINQLIKAAISGTVALALLGLFMVSQGEAFVMVWMILIALAVVIFVFLLVNIVLQQFMKLRPAVAASTATVLIAIIGFVIVR